MADAGLQAPDIPAPPSPPAQLVPEALQQPVHPTLQPSQQAQQIVYLNWSHF